MVHEEPLPGERTNERTTEVVCVPVPVVRTIKKMSLRESITYRWREQSTNGSLLGHTLTSSKKGEEPYLDGKKTKKVTTGGLGDKIGYYHEFCTQRAETCRPVGAKRWSHRVFPVSFSPRASKTCSYYSEATSNAS